MSPPNERGRVSNKPFLPLTVVQHRSASVRYTSDECCLEHSSLDTLRAGEQEPLQLTQLSVHLSSPSLLDFYFQAFHRYMPAHLLTRSAIHADSHHSQLSYAPFSQFSGALGPMLSYSLSPPLQMPVCMCVIPPGMVQM